MTRSHPSAGRFATLTLTVFIVLSVVACSGRSDGEHDDGLGPDVSTLGLVFTDVTSEAGLDALGSAEALRYGETMSSGAAVADVNGDGFGDIFLARPGLPNVLYMNNGDGTFTDATIEAGLAEEEPTYGSSAAVFFDADGDGHLDLYVTGFGRGRSRLYMNEGDGTFTDRTVESGLVLPEVSIDEEWAQMHGVSIADVNGDGALDLLVLHWHTAWLTVDDEQMRTTADEQGLGEPDLLPACDYRRLATAVADQQRDTIGPDWSGADALRSRSRLFLNDGNGRFRDGTAEMGLDFDDVVAFTGTFIDYDGDGWVDLAVSGDGCTSRLWRNINGTRFDDVTGTAGVGTDENGMGSVFKDIDGDGLPDWFITSIAYGDPDDECVVGGSFVGCSGNRLYTNNGDGTFTDTTDESGLRDGGWAWGIAAEDFANSGSIQIAVTNGFLDDTVERQVIEQGLGPEELGTYDRFLSTFMGDRTRFWMSDSSGRFHDVADKVGITDDGIGHALIPFDYDNDGRMDLLVVQAGSAPILYRNEVPVDRSWITIRLDDPSTSGNRWGDGARVEVFADDQTEPDHVGWITTSGSYESQKPPEYHVGFGDRRKPLSRIDVYWPGSTVPQTVTEVSLDQKLIVERS